MSTSDDLKCKRCGGPLGERFRHDELCLPCVDAEVDDLKVELRRKLEATEGCGFQHKRKVIGAVIANSDAVTAFLTAAGLKTDDMIAMQEGTLWGQEVVSSLFGGMLAGFQQGIAQMRDRQDRASENVTAWLEEDEDA